MSFLGRLRHHLRTPRWTRQLPAATRYRSPLALKAVEACDPARAGSWTWCEPPCEPRTLARPAPSFRDDPDNARVFEQIPAVKIRQPPVFVTAAERVFLCGARAYLTLDGHFFLDEAYVGPDEFSHLRSADPFINEFTGLSPSEEPGVFRIEAGNRPVQHLSGDVVTLCSIEGGNHGSFLFRAFPKLATLQGGTGRGRVLTPPLWPSNRELLWLAGIDEERVITQQPSTIYAIDRVIVPGARNPHGLLDQATLALYATLRARHGRHGNRRIYVSRSGWGHSGMGQRTMLNEAELIAALEASDFETVRPHEMTMREQIACFSSAAIVVGASGSAMFNTVFCEPGTKVVDIESEPHWIFTHCNLFGSCGLEYGIFEASAVDRDWTKPHKPFTVNVDALMARIAGL
jgi:capsular polysaccharide biosynthesis protein